MQPIAMLDLDTLAKDRLEDARILFRANRFWGAVYICGYAVEFGLKKKICNTLDRNEYPEIRDLKTHKLDILLILSGAEKLISTQYKAEWSIVRKWDPEQRYSVAPVNQIDADLMIRATDTLLRIL